MIGSKNVGIKTDTERQAHCCGMFPGDILGSNHKGSTHRFAVCCTATRFDATCFLKLSRSKSLKTSVFEKPPFNRLEFWADIKNGQICLFNN